jgi:uncharacterized protein with FMN-binding domain
MDSNLKKYMIGAIIVLAFFAYLVLSGSNDSSQNSPAVTEATAPPPAASGTTTEAVATGSAVQTPAGTPPTTGGGMAAGPTTSNTNATAAAAVSTGQYKNGTYTGPVADAFYGSLQVAAVVQGGQLTDVQFLQSPQDGGHTKKITETALPILKQEAISAQSAQVSVVSGATQTSEAFQQSLAGALAQAK